MIYSINRNIYNTDDKNNPGLSITDVGILRGYGVFEATRTYNNGKILLLKQHLERLKNSCKKMRIEYSPNISEIENLIHSLINVSNLNPGTVAKQSIIPDYLIKIIITGGASEDGFSFNPKTPTEIVLIMPLHEVPKEHYTNGVSLVTSKHQREHYEVKTLNYIHGVLELPKRENVGAFETLYISRRLIRECTTSNFFLIKENTVITPSGGILMGITRQAVVDLCKKYNINVQARPIKENELFSADETFITGSNKGIIPVVAIDSRKISTGKPGSITQKLIDLYNKAYLI